MNSNELVFTVFKSSDNFELSQIYQNGFHQVLDIFNVKKKYNTAKDYWLSADNVYAILVHSVDFKTIYGGSRLELKQNGSMIPIEKILLRQDEKVVNLIDELELDGLGEICALWKNRTIIDNPLDISVLIMATISLMKQLKLKTVLSISSVFIEAAVIKIGGLRFEKVGNKGVFNFKGYEALLDYYDYPSSRKLGNKRENKILNSLFDNPNYTYTEQYKNGINKYTFKLNIV